VNSEIFWNGFLSGAQALCYCSTAIDATRSRGVPQGARIGEQIGINIGELCQFKEVLDLGMRRVDGRGFNEGRHNGGVSRGMTGAQVEM
jgi:hypothetical protein